MFYVFSTWALGRLHASDFSFLEIETSILLSTEKDNSKYNSVLTPCNILTVCVVITVQVKKRFFALL